MKFIMSLVMDFWNLFMRAPECQGQKEENNE